MPKKRKGASFKSEMLKKHKCQSKPNLSQKDVQVVSELFSKRFSYTSLWTLPAGEMDARDSTCLPAMTVEDWITAEPTLTAQVCPDPALMSLKHELNATKDHLSCKDIDTWHIHTTKCNLAAKIIPFMKNLGMELCTQAWVKFYEILNVWEIVPHRDFLSVHLCEAPGAFVTSLNYYLQQNGINILWDWRATTLNPYYEGNVMGEMVADDRLIRHTYSQWFFGSDGSGDIMSEKHVKDLCSMVKQVADDQELPPLLVTADGSKDCQSNPSEQESSLSRLHYCEMIAACLILAPGGSFVFKVFTMFEPATVTLMFLLNIMFTQVHTIKPATSKSGNSELYLVCHSYRKNVQDGTLWKLLDLTVYSKNIHAALNFVKEIPVSFLQEHQLCCQTYTSWQMRTIEHNLQLFDQMGPELCEQLKDIQEYVLQEYITRTNISHLPSYKRIVDFPAHDHTAFTAYFSKDPRPSRHPAGSFHKNLKGTFQLRQNLSSMSWHDRVALIDIRENLKPDVTLQTVYPISVQEVDDWADIEMGAPFSLINNSRLCDHDLLSDLNLLLRNPHVQSCRQPVFMDYASNLGKMLAQLLSEGAAQPRPPGCTKSTIYWVAAAGGKDSPLYKSFIENMQGPMNVQHICVEEDFVSIASSPNTVVQVFCDVTSLCDEPGCEELLTRSRFMETVLQLLKHMSRCDRLVLLTSTFLSRLSAGLLYILARSFHITYWHGEANLWLHQLIVLKYYTRVSSALVKHLSHTRELLAGTGQTTAMEVVTFFSLLSDRKFVQFVTACNNYVITGFINLTLKSYRQGKTDTDTPAVT